MSCVCIIHLFLMTVYVFISDSSQGCGRDFTVQSNLRRHLKVHSPSPSPRRRLSAQMRYQFLQELLEKSEQRSFMTSKSYTAKCHSSSSEKLPTQNDCQHHDVSSLSSIPITSPSPSSLPKSIPYHGCNYVNSWINPPSNVVSSNHHGLSTQQSNPAVAPENTLPFILLQYPRGHNLHF